MNFTRDPIIETVITPREGCKLVIKNSKVQESESFVVEAIEVVSFGQSFFYRSKERPMSFLVPITDYDLTEEKQAKMVLKNASMDRSIKIAGGKELSQKVAKEEPKEEAPSAEKKKAKKKSKKSRKDKPEESDFDSEEDALREEVAPKVKQREFQEPPGGFISKLFPPPATLIHESLAKYKSEDPAKEDILPLSEEVKVEEEAFLESLIQPPALPPKDEIEEEQ